MIKGFRVYCYIDHKKNVFSDAQLDNRRRSKKMSNWALELQQFHIYRIWIRGEANILSDAPSRAPWEESLAQFLPIPDMPVRDLVIKMYQDPDGVEELVSKRRKIMVGDAVWNPTAIPPIAPPSTSSWLAVRVPVARPLMSPPPPPKSWQPGRRGFFTQPSQPRIPAAGEQRAAIQEENSSPSTLLQQRSPLSLPSVTWLVVLLLCDTLSNIK